MLVVKIKNEYKLTKEAILQPVMLNEIVSGIVQDVNDEEITINFFTLQIYPEYWADNKKFAKFNIENLKIFKDNK